MRCASFEQLADLVENRSSDRERSALEQHLAEGCKRCRSNWQWLQRVYALSASDSTVEPPDWLVQRAIAAFAQRSPVRPKKGLREIIASLVFDSFHALQPAEVRKMGESGRQLIYRAAPYDIDLRFIPSENFRYENAIGQVLGPRPDFTDVAGLKISVFRGKRQIATAATNPVGVFNLHNLPQGKYELTIQLQAEIIRIPDVGTSGLTD